MTHSLLPLLLLLSLTNACALSSSDAPAPCTGPATSDIPDDGGFAKGLPGTLCPQAVNQSGRTLSWMVFNEHGCGCPTPQVVAVGVSADGKTLACMNGGGPIGGPPDLNALCAHQRDCTFVDNPSSTIGSVGSSSCLCGNGSCYAPLYGDRRADAGSATPCGDRFCNDGEYCAITTAAQTPTDGSSGAKFACSALPTCDGGSRCDCIARTSTGCACHESSGAIWVTCAGL